MPQRSSGNAGSGVPGTRQKGLRNRFRTGASTYSLKRKGAKADRYGQWSNGVQTS